ncbi:MAG TPA: hypothetical protein VM261_23260 [Kofleriaceae bacterium]|nr:hypothetical protein [Kofleriaceae bacterium]
MKRDEDGEWHRLEPRPDLALPDDNPRPSRLRSRPAPGKVTRTLTLPAGGPPSQARGVRPGAHAGASWTSPSSTTTGALPDVFGGALPPAPSVDPSSKQPADVAAARSALDQAFAAHRTALVAAASQQGPSLEQAAAAEHSATLSAIATRETSARRIFADARAAIRATERNQVALATADAELTARRVRDAKAVESAYGAAATSEADRIENAGLMAATIVEASGATLLATLGGISGNALHDANLGLRPGEGEEVHDRLEAVRVQHRAQIASERYELRAAGINRAREIRKESRNVVQHVIGPMAEAADEVSAVGARLAAFFAHAATVSVEALAAAETNVMSRFAEQRTHAADVLHAAPRATQRVKERARAHLDTLTQRHVTVNQSLDRAGRVGQGVLTAATDEQRSLLDDLARSMLAATHGAPSAFAAEIAERRQQGMSALDASLAALSAALRRANAGFNAELDVQRTTVIQDYAAVENKLVAAALAPLGEVVASWRANGDSFVRNIHKSAAAIADGHAAEARNLHQSVKALVQDTILDARNPKRRAVESLRRSGGTVVRTTKSFAIGVGTFVAVNMAGGPVGAAAYMMYGAFENLDRRIEALESTWESRSTFGKIEGVFETTFVVAADQFGVTPIVEGMVHREAITHRHLNAEETVAKSTEGLLSALMAGAIERAATPGATKPTAVPEAQPPSRPARSRGEPHGEVFSGAERPQARGGDSFRIEPSGGAGATRPQPVSHVGRSIEALKRNGGSVRKALQELNDTGLNQGQMVEALTEMYLASGRDVGGTIPIADGTVVILSRRVGPNQPVNLVRPDGVAEFGTAEIYVDLTRGPQQPLAVRNVRGPGGDPLPAESRGEAPRETVGSQEKSSGVPSRSTAEREARLEELSRDPDHGGAVSEASRREAAVALALEDQGRITPPVRRPLRGDGHSGDFVDGAGGDWDVKGPMSRATLHAKIRASAEVKGRPPPKLDPDRPMNGEFTVETMLEDIAGELKAGERVIIDAQGLTPEDLTALKEALRTKGLVLDRDVVIYE